MVMVLPYWSRSVMALAPTVSAADGARAEIEVNAL
jgi:hypothetical protein